MNYVLWFPQVVKLTSSPSSPVFTSCGSVLKVCMHSYVRMSHSLNIPLMSAVTTSGARPVSTPNYNKFVV